ncbi:hypothetical protein [Pseudomonas sp.]|uniref:hypothetical protein n=1 Tax=Pseudomonas sp. TaxID=306 RepID=UPI0026046C5B|nr:hypothetical protein [Pseudomonas sp.]
MDISTDLISQCIGAAAALGTASFALVDATKAFGGGVSNCGFGEIEKVVASFFPPDEPRKIVNTQDVVPPLGLLQLLQTLRANWLNGTALEGQKAIAKSLLKLRFNTVNIQSYASATGMKVEVLMTLAEKIGRGASLTLPESDAWARFDLLLTAILDQGYERADQIYRNSAKAMSVVVSMVLAVFGFYIYEPTALSLGLGLIVGLAATPIAPIAKDLTSAISAGVKVAETFRK